MIGTFADPRISYDKNFTKDSLSFLKAKNAYFNLLTGPQYYMGARDFSMMDRTLKLAEKYNMHLLVIDSRMRIADTSFNEDTALKIISHFKSLNSKAFEGYYILGEVFQKFTPQIKKWTAFFKKNDPDKLVYYYLLPSYAFNSKDEYKAYVNNLYEDKASASNVIAYDYYPFNKNGELKNSYFYNLDLISKKAGARPFWSYILSTSTPNFSDPTAYQLSFSVFCPLAYGAKGIIYFTYETIPARYGVKFGEAIIDSNGNTTKKYSIVKNINEYVSKVIGPVIMNSTRIGTFHTSQNSNNETLSKSQVLSSNFLKIDNPNILVGVFKSKTSALRYLLLVNKKNDKLNDIHLSLQGNFTHALKIYPRMNELNGAALPKAVNANFYSGKTTFTINGLLPGEAVLYEFK
jgi:glycosyl hydrolase family 42 (putative beta-galactosidase)